jgi:hypothetical protein
MLPQGAVDGVAGPAQRKQGPQCLARNPALDRLAGSFQLFDHRGNAVAQIIDARSLAPAFMLAVAKRRHDHVHRIEHIARDPERLGEHERLSRDVERQASHQ